MLKRKEFILGAAVGLTFAAAATAGGVIDWPGANAAEASGRLIPSAGASGLAFAPPQGAPLSFADIFDQVSPAVVQIDVETPIERPRSGLIPIPGLPGFGFQAPQTPEAEQGEDAPTAQGAGSGFFISADGFIVTNNHVVANATKITVKLSDGRELPGRLVGRDQDTDLAVVKVEGSDFKFVSFEEAAEPRVGDWVIAVGNPFGLGGTATAGIVSARARDIGDGTTPYTDYLQIDAAINRGNSGGPTFDIYGRVIGVNSAIFSPTGGSVGIGFAIPASIAKSVTDRLMTGRAIERGYLGVTIETLSDSAREAADLPEGAYVNSVTPRGPADVGGLREGDLVVKLNGRDIKTSTELTRQVGQAAPGDELRLEIVREGRRQTLSIRSGTRPADIQAAQTTEEGAEPSPGRPVAPAGEVIEGLTVAPLTDGLRSRFSISERVEGLVITGVAEGSRAARDGYEAGFVIVQANLRPVRTVADFRAAVAAAKAAGREGIFLLVRTPAGNRSVVLELAKVE
ncbi:Do family serine endopeptidase [Brevundimonas sp. NIBR11]|uniref:Do family serine endopeptidase n=1 Tax=Brevundimonas sp. NIBR11 TaxID=3015999 RepID=UPI0022F04EC2|nr:Do family serine endopeptidase [Brevundimonas sp. NIBR11]WGM32127.1 Periplasmic serine endoprotease DegP [Brevundimonas sp. NIBR11]